MGRWEKVSVAIKGGLYGGVPKLALDVLDVLPLGDEQSREAMP